MANKIKSAIEAKAIEIQTRLDDGLISQEQIDDTLKNLDMDMEEYCKFQELKSESFLNKLLTLDEAQYVYNLLGEIPDTFNSQTIAVKIVLTQLFQELLGIKIKLMQSS